MAAGGLQQVHRPTAPARGGACWESLKLLPVREAARGQGLPYPQGLATVAASYRQKQPELKTAQAKQQAQAGQVLALTIHSDACCLRSAGLVH